MPYLFQHSANGMTQQIKWPEWTANNSQCVQSFAPDVGQKGWCRTLDDDKAPDPAITLTVYAALGRACAEAETALPPALRNAALEFQSNLRHRTYDAIDPDIRHDFQIVGPDTQNQFRSTITRVIWYPWAVQGLASWRACAGRGNAPPEMLAALDRRLGHLLGDLAPAMVADVTRAEAPVFLLGRRIMGWGRWSELSARRDGVTEIASYRQPPGGRRE